MTMELTYEEIDALRIKAFLHGSEENRMAYFKAASKWFQDEIYRRMDRERDLATLRQQNADMAAQKMDV